MKTYHADKNCMIFLKIIIILVMVALDSLIYIYMQNYEMVMYVMMSIITVVGVFFASIYLPLYFKNATFSVSNSVISKQSGFFIKTNQTMKIDSVQYITSIYIPLFRYIGFNFIIFNAFGGYLVFMFLDKNNSIEIFEDINKRITNDI